LLRTHFVEPYLPTPAESHCPVPAGCTRSSMTASASPWTKTGLSRSQP